MSTRAAAPPKVYRSFEALERDALGKRDGIHLTIDQLIDDMFADELAETRRRTTTQSPRRG